tara:strand:+ start:268 stop:459 length:192 start_codon:yes stop_codon:yes gene_type:complete
MTTATDPIDPAKLYTNEQLQFALKVGPTALRSFKAKGLRYTKRGRNHFFHGQDVVEFFTNRKD